MQDGTQAEDAPTEGVEITEEELVRRKAFLEFQHEDVERLTSVNDLAKHYADDVIEEFYKHLLSFEEEALFFKDDRVLRHVKARQKEYFLRLTRGTYDVEYARNRLKIGAIHERIDLPVKSYLGMYNFYLRSVAARLMEAYRKKPEEAFSSFLSLMKLTFLDIGLAIDTYIYSRERTIRKQQEAINELSLLEAIRELSTPILQIRDHLLILPMIGIIDSQRAKQLTDGLLHAIRANRAKVVVIDITGVATVDSKVANHLIQTVAAARLMGATTIITGLSAEVAQALVTLGVDLTKINTIGDLQGGLEEAERLLGYKVVPLEELPNRPTAA